MAGHSKWANTKHRKAAQDAKRGKIFTKIIRELVTAARLGGGDAAMKKKVLFLPLALTIVGCPGERINIPEQRSVMINENHICFSVDKNDLLNRYVIS
jgi:hypothetical protein